MQPRHALGVGLPEWLFAQGDQRGAVVEGFDFDVGGIFRARCEVRRQVGDPADAGSSDAARPRPRSDREIWEVGRKKTSRTFPRGSRSRARISSAACSSDARHGRPVDGRSSESRMKMWFRMDRGSPKAPTCTPGIGVARLAEIVGRRPRMASPDRLPTSGQGRCRSRSAPYCRSKAVSPRARSRGREPFPPWFRRVQPTPVDRIEIRQSGDESESLRASSACDGSRGSHQRLSCGLSIEALRSVWIVNDVEVRHAEVCHAILLNPRNPFSGFARARRPCGPRRAQLPLGVAICFVGSFSDSIEQFKSSLPSNMKSMSALASSRIPVALGSQPSNMTPPRSIAKP